MTLGALILIDIQEGFDDPVWGTRNNPEAEANAARLLSHWRAQDAPVFHIQHLSTTAGSPLNPDGGLIALKSMVAPRDGEPVLTKHVNSAFIGTRLEKLLQKQGVEQVTICGLTTPHCVSTTTRMAANLGFSATLVHDACATFAGNADNSWRTGAAMTAEEIHISALDQLNGEFAAVTSTDQVLA
ncbi:Nicotinamidase-related amidase [Aliiroseovarius halocynthiae]|uniref:Cysteine hydrolase n=1 Tax=Aliiroseovarius halocynthiae TaxID=985055 RepID=A0A545SVB6_9RHOB|nr:cysteine hydrolase family protein [Aliiroseovarius halocynthiae]TQV68908.1 cysteine hydrolase [Aliiroseovarius halocynthiae]SMR71465.1 Nicotinamidase-related amidase [Aliiroseovarius halocynthiae]